MADDTASKTDYPVYDHDQHGHAGPDVEQGRVYVDESGRVVCSEHGDTCATDGSDVRAVTEAPWEVDPETGQPVQNYDKLKKLGDSRLYKCTVCGQGTWAIAG